MSRRAVPAVVLTALLAAALPAAASAAKPTCAKRSGDTLYRDKTLRVYQTTKRSKSDPDAFRLTLRACKPSSKKTPKIIEFFTNDLDGTTTIDSVTRNGKYFTIVHDEATGTNDAIAIRLFKVSTYTNTFTYRAEGADVPDFYATVSGGFAVIDDGGGLVGYAARDSASGQATGRRWYEPLGAVGLAGDGDTIYWSKSGVVKSATLKGAASGDGSDADY
jgi:hypothetical protein